MKKENYLFGTALATIVVMVALAISIAWVIPPHHVSEDYVEYNKRDTEADIRRKCNCNDTKNVTVYVNRIEPTKWTDPWIEEVLQHQRAKLPMTNASQYPAIVSILIKKYADDDDETMLDFGGTGYIIQDKLVIADLYCFRTIPHCAVNRPPASCTQMIRIRSGSPYWSMGGRLRNTKNYFVNTSVRSVIFEVPNKFDKAHEKPGIYPQGLVGKLHGNYSFYTFAGFCASNETWNQRYKVASSSKIYVDYECGHSKERNSSQNYIERKFRPMITTCSDLCGYETEKKYLDLIKPYDLNKFYPWIMAILGYNKDIEHMPRREWEYDELYPLGPVWRWDCKDTNPPKCP